MIEDRVLYILRTWKPLRIVSPTVFLTQRNRSLDALRAENERIPKLFGIAQTIIPFGYTCQNHQSHSGRVQQPLTLSAHRFLRLLNSVDLVRLP